MIERIHNHLKKSVKRTGRAITHTMGALFGTAPTYSPLISITISKENLISNLRVFQQINKQYIGWAAPVVPVLKSNAYGHGLVQVASILEEYNDSPLGKDASALQPQLQPAPKPALGQKPALFPMPASRIPFFAVDTYFEALTLREHGISTPLVIIGYTPAETILNNTLAHVSFMVGSMEVIELLARKHTGEKTNRQIDTTWIKKITTSRRVTLHLKVDTGMHRQGILPDEVPRALDLISSSHTTSSTVTHTTSPLILEGLMSHFASADSADPAFTKKQIATWNAIVDLVQNDARFASSLTYIHLSNTAGHAFAREIKANVSRLGIGLFGISQAPAHSPTPAQTLLKPVLEMQTVITSVKHIKKGESVGYSNTFTAPHDMTIATIPVGYFEGLDRRLSNKGFIKIASNSSTSNRHGSALNNYFAPIIGRVSMNITSIDITELAKKMQVHVGDSVTVISRQSDDKNSLVELARLADMIPYELLVHIPAHLKRTVV